MIQVSHLTKYYGDFLAVNDLSFEIEDGHVYGFLGPNGAGKSTTMNIMTGCLSPTEGLVKIGDFDILEQPEQAKSLIGYLPEQPPVYVNETPREYLTFVGEAKGLKKKELAEQLDAVMESTGIADVSDRLIGALSKGYRQRVGIAQALMGNPQVIILDEPTVGLDPIQIIEIRTLIKELGKNHTVILSSHILSEVQAVCEQVLIISKGKLVAFDTPENLEKLLTASSGITFRVQADKAQAEAILPRVQGLADWTIQEEAGICHITANLENAPEMAATAAGESSAEAAPGAAGEASAKTAGAMGASNVQTICGQLTLAFASEGLPILEMTTKKANLEDVFLELTEAGAAELITDDTGEASATDDAEKALETKLDDVKSSKSTDIYEEKKLVTEADDEKELVTGSGDRRSESEAKDE